jgi:hypothetical protein
MSRCEQCFFGWRLPDRRLLVCGGLCMIALSLTAAVFVYCSPRLRVDVERSSPSDSASQMRESAWLEKVPEVGLTPVTTKEQLAAAFVRIVGRHGNGSDAFLDSIVADQPELAGLPYSKGDECKLDRERADELGRHGSDLRARNMIKETSATLASKRMLWVPDSLISDYFAERRVGDSANRDSNSSRSRAAAVLPAAMQILAVQAPEFRIAIAKTLQTFPSGDDASISALVRLAVFDPESAVRKAAIDALKREPAEKYGPKLLEQLRYPWPVIADRAADAIVALQRTDLLPQLVEFLDELDPAAPFGRDDGRTRGMAIRELVKINHHRNCCLCHAPTKDASARNGLVARVPAPDEALELSDAQRYYSVDREAPAIRADETYLLQDFSVMQPVANPGKWPVLQRFDFFVRTRTLTLEEAKELKREPPPDVAPSANHRAVLTALGRLTSTYAGLKASDWRPVIARRLAEAIR